MTNFVQKLQSKYCLRYAGGIYWLLDCGQEGFPYREPVPINEVGADIWRLKVQGQTDAEIVDYISAEYGVDKTIVRQDVAEFMKQLDCMEAREKYE